jgi:hypothetical protein
MDESEYAMPHGPPQTPSIILSLSPRRKKPIMCSFTCIGLNLIWQETLEEKVWLAFCLTWEIWQIKN